VPLAAPNDLCRTRNETTVLFLAANPVEMQLLQLGEECRAIEDKIRKAKFREQLRFRSCWAARADDLLQALYEDDPTVLHFSGHGAGAQGLCFLAEDGRAILVNSDGLGQVIRAAGGSVQLVVLNACYTRVQAEALVVHVPCVIGMPSAIGDDSAIVYAAELYRALAFGKSVAIAHQCGLAALALHSMAGNMRDVDVAEAVLRTAPPELLVRIGIDATQVHIVQGALLASPVSTSSGESRIHLEVDIEADFETLDASTLSKLVSEICRVSGGRPVRILCVTKGSIRLHLSFEPDAAKTIMSLRESGRLNQISGLLISNVIDLGPVEISAQAVEHAEAPQLPSDPAIDDWSEITAEREPIIARAALVPALTIVSHPVTHRAGERCLLDKLTTGGEVRLWGNAPDFSRPDRALGQPLGDSFGSRKPIQFAPGPGGAVRVIADVSDTPVIAGWPVEGSASFTTYDLVRGVPLELAEGVVLLLHMVDRSVDDAADSLGIVGTSTGIRRVRTAIERIVDLAVPVLIRGETGTGKELVARAIHARSPRREGPFVSVNLGAIPRELAVAELFGSSRGQFSGAPGKQGLFRTANGGTLFLDEIGEAPLELQVRLLRALETREFYPVGSEKPVPTEVRLIAATGANLEEQIHLGQFRAPLLHRLARFELRIPPLRERRDDIGLLFYHFAREELEALGEVHRLSLRDPNTPPWIPAHVAIQLVSYSWPGNIQELRNVTRQLVVESRGLPQLRVDPRIADQLGVLAQPIDTGPPQPDPTRDKIIEVLRQTHGKMRTTAQLLKISRRRLYRLCNGYDINPGDDRDRPDPENDRSDPEND
jgi:two-component system nitrogen regulation response regulator GlnG